MARALAANGAKRIYLLGRRLEPLTTAAQENPRVFRALQCDVTDKTSLQSAVETITLQIGYVNLVVANAGAVGSFNAWNTNGGKRDIKDVKRDLFDDNDMGKMDEVFRVNVTGAFFSMVAFLELLDKGNQRALASGAWVSGGATEVVFGAPGKQGGKVPSVQSQIVVTSSISAFSRMNSSPPGYCGSKAAILQLAKQASTQLGPYGIRVNVLAPGSEYFLSFGLGGELVGRRHADSDCV